MGDRDFNGTNWWNDGHPLCGNPDETAGSRCVATGYRRDTSVRFGDLMSSFDAQLEQVRSSVGALPGWAGRTLVVEPAISVLASPSWRGVDGAPWRAVDKYHDYLRMLPDMRDAVRGVNQFSSVLDGEIFTDGCNLSARDADVARVRIRRGNDRAVANNRIEPHRSPYAAGLKTMAS